VTTQFIPLEGTANAMIDELTHLINSASSVLQSDQIMRVASLSMELIKIQAIFAIESRGEPEVNPTVKRIHDVLELTANQLSARHAAREHLEVQSKHLVH
jgi:hypothetical protein